VNRWPCVHSCKQHKHRRNFLHLKQWGKNRLSDRWTVFYGFTISESWWCSVERYCNQEIQHIYTMANARLIRKLMQNLKYLRWYFFILKKQQINEINILFLRVQAPKRQRVYPSSQLLNQRTNLHQIWYATAGSYKLVIYNFLRVVIATCRRNDLCSDTLSEVPRSCTMLDRQKYAFVQPLFFL
jgi:hypothetical protein